MIEDMARELFKNAEQAGIIVYLLFTIIFLGYALWKQWLVLGPTFHKVVKAFDKMEETTSGLRESATTHRERGAGLEMQVTYLKAEVADLRVRLARCEGESQERGA